METFSDSTGIRGSVESLIGGRNENQDSYGMAETRLGMLVAVCDGMGGGPAGKTASSLATQAILDYVSGADTGKSPVSVLSDAVVAANEAVLAAVAQNPALKGMGTTCVCVLITPHEAYIAHVGDSRCYQLRGSKAVFRTADHSYVGEMVRHGTLTEEEARNSQYSNVITRAIGVGQDIDPEIDVVDYKPGDRFALMSDGIWGTLPEPQLVKFLSKPENPAIIVPEIAGNIDALGADNGGGHDNLTLAIIDTPRGKAPVRPMAEDVERTVQVVNIPTPAPKPETAPASTAKVATAEKTASKMKVKTEEKPAPRKVSPMVMGLIFAVVIAGLVIGAFFIGRSDSKSGDDIKAQSVTINNNDGADEIVEVEPAPKANKTVKNEAVKETQEDVANQPMDEHIEKLLDKKTGADKGGTSYFEKAKQQLLSLKTEDTSSNMSFSEKEKQREKKFDEMLANIQLGIDNTAHEATRTEATKILKELKLHKKAITRLNKKYKDPEAEGIAYIETYSRALEKLK